MIKKDFKHGDMYITTSKRDGLTNSIYAGPIAFMTGIFDRDITFEEAVDIHTKVMQQDYPKMNFTKEKVENAIKEYADTGFFVNTRGEAVTYDNHEKPDIFDIRYINGEDISTLVLEKNKWIKEHNVQPDEDSHYRCWE